MSNQKKTGEKQAEDSTQKTIPPASAAAQKSQQVSNEEVQKLVEMAREQTKQLTQKIPVLGPITWLLMQQPGLKHMLISEIEWRVMPALATDQYKLFMRDGTPAAFVSWAKLSDEVIERYKQPPHRLMPQDWRTGDTIFLFDVVTPFGGAQDVLKDIRENVFAGINVHQLAPQSLGNAKTITWPAQNKAKT